MTITKTRIKRYKAQGFTLTELMIALVLGLLVIAAAGSIFLQAKRSNNQNEQVSRIQENGRFGMKNLVRDISMAGFLGEHLDRTQIEIDDDIQSISNECGAAGWYTDLSTLLQIANGPTGNATTIFPCLAAANAYLAGTDVVAIKRIADYFDARIVDNVATQCNVDDLCCGTSVPAGCSINTKQIYLQSNKLTGLIYDAPVAGTSTAEQPPKPREHWRLLNRVYFIRPWTISAGDNNPCLSRMRLVGSNAAGGGVNFQMQAECLAEGIENMQIELGIDNQANDPSDPNFGIADFYTATPTAADMQQAVTAKIYLLVRSSNELPVTNNSKTYNLGGTTVGPFNDGFQRRVFSTNVRLRNISNLNALGL